MCGRHLRYLLKSAASNALGNLLRVAFDMHLCQKVPGCHGLQGSCMSTDTACSSSRGGNTPGNTLAVK